MKSETRLHIWIATTDDAGKIVRNIQDIKHVTMYTKEVEWLVPTDLDSQMSYSTAEVKAQIVTDPIIESELEGVDYQIIRSTDEFNFISILKQFEWIYSKDNPVTFELKVESGSTAYGDDKYNIPASVVDSLLRTFVGVTLSVGGHNVALPNVTYSSELKSLVIENAVVECNDMIASFETFGIRNCDVVRPNGEPAFCNITVHNSLTFSRVTFKDPVYFQFISKNDNLTAWKNLEAIIQFVKVEFNYEPTVMDTLIKILNFSKAQVFDFYSDKDNVSVQWFSIIGCKDVVIDSVNRVSSLRRKVFDITIRDCENISIGDSSFITTLQNDAPITDSKPVIFFDKLEQSKISLYNLTLKNARLFVCGASIIDKIILDTVINTKCSKLITMITSKVKEMFIRNSTLSNFEAFNALPITSMKFKDCTINAEGAILIDSMDSMVFENSSFESTETFEIQLSNTGRVDVENTIIKAKEITIRHLYTADENNMLKTKSYQDVYDANKSTLSISELSTISGRFSVQDIGRVIFMRAKLKCPSIDVKSIQTGESNFDVHADYFIDKCRFEVQTMRNFTMVLTRATRPFTLSLVNTKGDMKVRLRDPSLDNSTENEDIQVYLDNSPMSVELVNEALTSSATVGIGSSNSLGASFEYSSENRSDEAILMRINPLCPDFPKMKRRADGVSKKDFVLYG